ncbi:MAG TPA: DUF1223 domain-containing protein [Pseudolabrys sp.]|jgi:hypothetical protein|nr:DUF1223 domain-containing protein [Pseudolabrys sp.]
MKTRHIAVSAAFVLSAVSIALPAGAGETRAVIELFTSQGCSSCPAADKLLGELSKDHSLITMSLPVDYWDYLGWKDTLALHGHSTRERAYADARGDREVYTPQAVVNGLAPVIGSDKAAIEKAIAQTYQKSTPLVLPVTLAVADGKVTASVPAAKDNRRNAEVWLCPITHKVSVVIERGENSGKTLTYYNVVRRWVKLGDWAGTAQKFSVPLADVATPDIDSFAVVVQSGVAAKPGVVLGAAATDLH